MNKKEYIYDPRIVADELGESVELVTVLVGVFIDEAYEFYDDLYRSLDQEDFDNIYVLSEKLYGMAINLRVEDALEVITVVKDERDKLLVKMNLDIFYKTIAGLKNDY